MSATKILAAKAAFLIGVLAFGSAAAIETASAADRALKAPALPGVYNWTGFYGGVNFGSVLGQTHAGSAVAANGVIAGADANNIGATGGVQAGFNWQFNPSWLIGLGGDFGYLGVKRSNTDWFDGITIGQKASWYGTLRARTGYVTGRSLLYITGGLAIVRMEDTFGGNTATGLAPTTSETTRTGWTAGGGIETKLNRNWSAKTEYLYIATGTHSFAANPYAVADRASFTSQFHVIKAGLNYNFGGGNDGASFADSRLQRDWSGLYAGLNLGLGASATHITGVNPLGNADMNGQGFAGGVQAGYNVMLGSNWFAGIEADFNYLGIDRSYQDWGDAYVFAQKTNWYGTLRGRAGYNTGAALLYLTGGGAAVKVEDKLQNLGFNLVDSNSQTATGWTVGGGIEAALNSRWSAKVEALHIDAGSARTSMTVGGLLRAVDYERRFQVVRAGLNYRLGGGN